MSIKVQFWGHPEDRELLASPRNWDDFVQSAVWIDIKNFLKDRLEIGTMKDLVTEESVDRIRQLQAEAQMTQLFLELPMILQVEAEKQTDEDKQNRRSV